MIQAPTDILKANVGESVAAVSVLWFAMLIPVLLVTGGLNALEVHASRLEAFRPVIYMDGAADQDAADELAEELGQWKTVGEVEVRTPRESLEMTTERLGEESVAELGLSESMFPYSLVIVPAESVTGHIDLVAHVAGLEARSTVETVDVPDDEDLRTLRFARWLLALGAMLGVGSLWLGVSQTRWFLASLVRRKRGQWRILEAFGASPKQFRRISLVRGLSVGAAAGVGTFATGFALFLLWRSFQDAMTGVEVAATVWMWMTIASPLVVGPLIGWASGMWTNRNHIPVEQEPDELGLRYLIQTRE